MNAAQNSTKKARRPKRHHGKQPCNRTLFRIPLVDRGGRSPLSPCRHAAMSVVAAALAGSLATSGVPAIAQETHETSSERTTTVSLQGTVSQLSVSVPTSMPVKVKSDGSFIETQIQIVNNSIFDVHVSGIATEATEPFNIVERNLFAQENEARNVLWMTLTAGEDCVDLGESALQKVDVDSQDWNVLRSESGNNALSITSNGAIKNADNVTNEQEEALRVFFTVEAGKN